MTHSFNFTAQEVRLVLHSFQTVKQLHPGMRIRSNQRSFIYAWEISQLCENILDFSSDSHSHCGFFHRISLSFQVVPKFMYTNLHMKANFLDRNNQTILMFATNKALGKRPSHCLSVYWENRCDCIGKIGSLICWNLRLHTSLMMRLQSWIAVFCSVTYFSWH